MCLGWGNYAPEQAPPARIPPHTARSRPFSEQLNAHSEQLNATMGLYGTNLVAFTLTSDQIYNPLNQMSNAPSEILNDIYTSFTKYPPFFSAP